ncbi:carcinoembryonic antigen-related cell adhesion molecule 3-like isoform X2 [Acipenser ruthenus]|uniref:carcinoembryonic antigen-related cell adhesion molecule 3-like isoform X2 n=1 Tax=Acipenser ruthenus TaxID=7906 RepID=UPI0027410F97|nr:carcinoembryonic antigen-related cell adhesion molecule 3-like isoform X2 [Acipenser ruthenus]
MINLNKFIPYWLFLFSLNAYVTAENISVPVYGALGESVYLHFNTTLNSSAEVQWKRGVNRIAVFKNNRTAFDNPYKNRTEIFANGTLRLDRTQKNDSGDYSVEVFNTDGTNIFKGSMQVYIQVTAENISVPVYGALGESVYLHLNTILNSSAEVQWKRGVNRIGVIKNSRTVFYDPYINRTGIFANGTLRLDRTQKNDSGDYSVDVFNTDGTNIFKGSMQFYIHVTAENISVPVYGALGESVYLHFNTTLNSSVEVQWNRRFNRIAVFKNNRTAFDNPYKNRTQIFANGTLRLDRTQKNDSGDYSVDVFNTDGTNIFKGSMQVYIQEAVSQPVVHSTCLSQGKVLLVCTVDKGDNVSFNWSLEGVPLNTSLAYFSDEEHVVILKKHVSGNLVCIATNQVSTNQSDSVISNCSEPVSKPVVHSSCLSHGEVLLVCTVDKGDNASFNWSLDGVPLNTSLAYFSDKEHIVILKKNVTGDLVCIAKNQINEEKSDSVKSNCSSSEPKMNPTSTPNLETQFHCTLENGTLIKLSGGKEGEAFQFLINKSMIITNYTNGFAFCSLQTCSSNCSGNLTTEPGDASNAEDADILKYVLGGSALLVIVMLSFTLLCMCKNKKRKENAHSVITQNRSDEQHVSLSTMIPETASTAIQDDQVYTQVVKKGGKKKSKCKPKEDGELVYAQVVIKEGKKKPIHDESVVYDEVKGKDKNNQQQDDSVVYAAINKRRNI